MGKWARAATTTAVIKTLLWTRDNKNAAQPANFERDSGFEAEERTSGEKKGRRAIV